MLAAALAGREAFLRALAAARLPPLRAITSERTTFVLYGALLGAGWWRKSSADSRSCDSSRST